MNHTTAADGARAKLNEALQQLSGARLTAIGQGASAGGDPNVLRLDFANGQTLTIEHECTLVADRERHRIDPDRPHAAFRVRAALGHAVVASAVVETGVLTVIFDQGRKLVVGAEAGPERFCAWALGTSEGVNALVCHGPGRLLDRPAALTEDARYLADLIACRPSSGTGAGEGVVAVLGRAQVVEAIRACRNERIDTATLQVWARTILDLEWRSIVLEPQAARRMRMVLRAIADPDAVEGLSAADPHGLIAVLDPSAAQYRRLLMLAMAQVAIICVFAVVSVWNAVTG